MCRACYRPAADILGLFRIYAGQLGNTATYDAKGNAILGRNAVVRFATVGFPVTPGLFNGALPVASGTSGS